MKKQLAVGTLDIIVPISLELDWPGREEIIASIRQQHERYGFNRFALAAPCGGWRSIHYPPMEVYERLAETFLEIKNELAGEGIVCGWWNTLTVKSGPSEEFVRMTSADGSLTPMASCSLDPAFRRRLAESMATFARIAKPAFIFLEDDYAMHGGCFCKRHLQAFSEREGRAYAREELVEIFGQKTPASYALLRKWRELMKDTMVGMSVAIRTEVDKESPAIPIGYMQSGAADMNGDCTEAICRALAGPRHTPFSRLYGTFYNGGETLSIPSMLYHPLYSRQHIAGDFRYYHESDTFPHTRFYASGAQMRAIMGAAYSYGFEGSTFQTQQLLDDPNEETIYGRTYAAARARFHAAHRVARQCSLKGVQLCYDPFWNTASDIASSSNPLWVRCVSLFGIPHTTLADSVAFWDVRQAQYADDEAVKRQLAGNLFLDGDAAKCLCERGYAEYLGVELGEDVALEGMLRFDLGAREIIREPFCHTKGRHMPSAHMFSNGKNGFLRRMTVIDPACEVISDEHSFDKKLISPALTRFVNKLGGHVVVMGMTLDKNQSQALFNYRRQRLFQELLTWCADEYAFVKNDADIYTIMNRANDPQKSGFKGMLTLINLCDDALDSVALHLPPAWRMAGAFHLLNAAGEWLHCPHTSTDDGIIINATLESCDPMFVLVGGSA